VTRYLAVLAACAALGQTRESIEQQKKSIARQREAIAMFRAPSPAIQAPVPDCEPLPEAALAPLIEGAARAQQLPSKLLRGVIAQESAFRPCAVSKKGAQGLMQLMPATAEQFDVEDPFEPEANIAAGAKFLRQLVEKYGGDLALALAAYNAGPAIVDEANAIPDIKETRDYVADILGKTGLKRIDLPSVPKPRPIGN
jgi:soluble lytic murein transglycosylase-like protein